jgi:hypothetical protein
MRGIIRKAALPSSFRQGEARGCPGSVDAAPSRLAAMTGVHLLAVERVKRRFYARASSGS